MDVLSFGGTKNGLMFGEAVVFSIRKLAEGFKYTRKQNMQLMSKMRYVAAQFEAQLTDELPAHEPHFIANNAARRLAEKLSTVPGVTITQPVEGKRCMRSYRNM
ncbi:MAG: hypothetical protein MZV65_45155 [Chromatiales bacterium]|nr:hypothetical protein [Chromatiales bacterium]